MTSSPDLTLREAAELAGVPKAAVEKAIETDVIRAFTPSHPCAWRINALRAVAGGRLFFGIEAGKTRRLAGSPQKGALERNCPSRAHKTRSC